MLESPEAQQAAEVYSLTDGVPGAGALEWSAWVSDALVILGQAVAHHRGEARGND